MASWGSFAWGFFAGLVVGEVALVFLLNFARQGSAVGTVESPLLAAEHEMPAGRESFPAEATLGSAA
jgi:hypothetical protein